MKRLYMDRPCESGCVGYFLRDTQLVWAGCGVHVMPVSERKRHAQYETFAREHEIFFIFEDDVPQVDFYAVPYLEIFAHDACGGFLATMESGADAQSDGRVIYISKDRKCLCLKETMKEFIQTPQGWKERMKPDSEISLFSSFEEAAEHFPFWKPEAEEKSSSEKQI